MSSSRYESSASSSTSGSGFDDGDSSGSGASSVVSWVSWFCSLPGHEFFCLVPEEYIEDDFNLTGLAMQVPLYSEALDTILDMELDSPGDGNGGTAEPDADTLGAIEESAEMLYGLIHARFILTRPGLELMAHKLSVGDFGVCPRYVSRPSPPIIIPDICVGDQKSSLQVSLTGLVPAKCVSFARGAWTSTGHERQVSKHLGLDGAFFGTTFPHLFYLTYPSLIPPMDSSSSSTAMVRTDSRGRKTAEEEDEDDRLPDYEIYTPRIFGFRVSENSHAGPRMAWLRQRSGLQET
ncbi:MAG: hypothetical protein SGCHY_001459 [Lobulomycetales sp.]